MRRNLAVVTGIAAGAAALALISGPTLAQAVGGSDSITTATCPCGDADGTASGYAMNGRSGNGSMMGRGSGPNGGMLGAGQGMRGDGSGSATTLPTGTLTAAQKSAVAAMADEEKLAHDLYLQLASRYPATVQFARIAQAESRHLEAVRAVLSRYGSADPTAGLAAGVFASTSMQSLYDSLLAGATSSSSALAAGVTVEKADIADLTSALSGVTAPDVVSVLTHLRTASQHHLTAFGG